MDTMKGSAGSAEKELSIITESLTYKFNALKEAGTGIAQNLFQRDDMGVVIDGLTAILNIVDKLTEQLGLFGTVGTGIALFSVFKNKSMVSNVVAFGKALFSSKVSFDDFASAAENAGSSVKTFATSASGIAAGIGLAVAAISIAIQQYKKYREELRRSADETIKTANEQAESFDSFEKAYAVVSKYSTQAKLTANEEKELQAAIEGVSGILGEQAGAFDSTTGSAREYLEILQSIKQEELSKNLASANEGEKASRTKLSDTADPHWAGISVSGSKITTQLNKQMTGVDTHVAALKIVNDLMSDYIDIGTQCQELKPINFDSLKYGSQEYTDAIADYYYQLIDLRDALALDDLAKESDIYSSVDKSIQLLSADVEEYVKQKERLLVAEYEEANGILPKNIDEYNQMRKAILDSLDYSDSYKDILAGLLDTDFASYIDTKSIKAQVKRVFDDIQQYVEEQNPNAAAMTQNISKNMSDWFDSLDVKDQQIVYDLIINSDDKNSLTISSLQSQLDEFNESTKKAREEAAQLTDDQISEVEVVFKNATSTDAEFDNLMSKFNELDAVNKKYVFDIAVDSDRTQYYTFTRWSQELDSIGECGKTTAEQMSILGRALDGIGEDAGLSEKINNYTSKLSKLEDVLTKIDTGTLTENDKISLALEYPELAGTINDTDALKNAIQDLIDTSNQGINDELDSMIDELSESAPQAAAALQAIKDAINGLQSTGGFNFDIEAEIQKFDNLYGAMKNSVSGTGLKSQDIENVKAMFSGLKGYDPSVLFERTEHGIHLNTTALRALQSEYESTKKLDIQNELRDLKQQYNDTKTELEGLTKGTDEYNQKMAQLTGIENQINDVQTLAAQYEGLTSAYNKWIMAQSAGEEGDMYDSITNSLEDIKKLYDDGLIGTNAFRAAVQMMTDEDLSTASIDKLIATYEAGYPAMERYFTKGHDGALTFLEDVQKINTEWAKQNEDGSWEIDFGIGNDAEIAQAISDMTGLKVSTEEVQMIMRKLSDYGFDIKLDSAYTSIDELKSRIEESEEKLKELGQEPIDIDVNVELDDIDSEIEKAQQLIQEINDSDIDPDVKTAQLEDANNKLDVLISKKLEATEPAFMQLSTSDVDSGLASTLTLLQQFQNAVEQEYICTVKGDTAGVEEAHTKVESLAQEIAALDSDTLAEIGITVDTSSAESTVSSVKSSIETGDVSFGVDVDTSGVESAKTTIDSVDGKDVEVTVTADNTALDNLKTALDSLQDKTITVTANTVGTENVDTLKTSTDALIDKTVTATANAVGKENVDALKQSIDSLYDRTVTSTAKVVGTNLVIALKAAIDALYNKTVSVGANVFGTAAVQGLRSAIDSLYSKTVTATTVTRTVAGVDGTAHANGTAFAQGDWGTKDSGVALGGELGQEIVVRNGHFFTIGDNGAEFFKYKKGDIIFNAEQSKQILEKGKITHGNGRGKALAEGTAFSSGSGRFTSGGQTVYNSGGSNNSSNSSSNRNSSSSSSSSSSTKDFKETFDWIEVAIDRIERAITKLDTKASSTYRSWSERNKNLSSEMGKVSDEIALQQAGYTRYMQQANSVGLSTEWMNKVKNGLIDINTITDEGLAEKIKEAQEWYIKICPSIW